MGASLSLWAGPSPAGPLLRDVTGTMNADMLSKIWWAHERFIVIGARPIYPLGLGYVDQLCNTGFEDLVLLNHTWSTLRHRCEISLTRDSRHRGGFEDLVLLDPTPALERSAVCARALHCHNGG